MFTGANQVAGASYDAAGNQTVVNGDTLAYDAESRMTRATESAAFEGGQANYFYEEDGRRVEKSLPGGTTVYVYDGFGQLAAEYNTAITPAAPCRTCYLSWDHLGSIRLVTDQNGTLVAWHDYLPFGEEIPANTAGRNGSWGCSGDNVNQKFTGKERDSESGRDYFGARYYGSALGRFTSPDPSMLSAVMANPQSWNRYSYALNNPLQFVDPNGELWVASGDANNPYSWVDQCGKAQTCYEAVAAGVSGNLRVYGSENAQDITTYAANDYGLINVADVANHPDANFESQQTPGHEENYLGVNQAAALFNVAEAYGQKYPDG